MIIKKKILIALLGAWAIAACSPENEEVDPTTVAVTDPTPRNVSLTQATLYGNANVKKTGATTNECTIGIEWTLASDDEFIESTKSISQGVVGSLITCDLHHLRPDTRYIYRTYVIARGATYLGTTAEFTTQSFGNIAEVARMMNIHKSVLLSYIYGMKEPSTERMKMLRETLHLKGAKMMSA